MKIAVRVSKAFIESQLLLGVKVHEQNWVDVSLEELSQEERNLLFTHSVLWNENLLILSKNKESAYYSNVSLKKAVFSPEFKDFRELYPIGFNPNIEGILSQCLDWNSENTLKVENEKGDFFAFIERLKEKDSYYILGSYYYKKNFSSGDKERLLDYADKTAKKLGIEPKDYILSLNDSIAEWEKFSTDLAKKAKEEKDKAQQAKEEKETAEKARKEALKEWAIENGSELLRARIEGEFNWFELANAEYNDQYIETFLNRSNTIFGTWEDVYSNVESAKKHWLIKNPTLEQIKTLKEYKGIFPDAQNFDLTRIKFEDDFEESHQDYLTFQIECPLTTYIETIVLFLNDYPSDEDEV